MWRLQERVLVAIVLVSSGIPFCGMASAFRRIDIGLASHNIKYIFQDHFGYMWFSGSQSVHRYDGSKIVEYENVSDTKYATLLFEDKENVLWAVTDFGTVLQFNRELNRFIQKFSMASIFQKRCAILSQDEDHDGYFWIATAGVGLIRLDPKSGQFKEFRFSESDANSIMSDGVAGVVVDKNNNVWVGTHRGLCRYDRDKSNFIRFSFIPTEENYNYHLITSLCLHSNGKIYIGTFKGLRTFDPENPSDHFVGSSRSLGSTLIDKAVARVIEDKEGQLWVATEGKGLNRLDPMLASIQTWKFDGTPFGICSDDITTVFSDCHGNIWTVSRLGEICVFDVRTKPVHYLSHSPLKKYTLSKEEIRCVFKENDSILWTGLSGKLNRINILTGFARTYFLDSHRSGGTPLITKIVGNKAGEILALSREGIYRYDRRSDQFEVQNTNLGSGQWFVTMAIDDQNSIWTASSWPMSLTQSDARFQKTYQHFGDQELKRQLSWIPRKMEVKYDRLFLQNETSIFYLEQNQSKFVKINLHFSNSSLEVIDKNEEIMDFVPYSKDKFIYLNDQNQIILIQHFNGALVARTILYNEGSGGRVQSLATDLKGQLWVASATKVSCIHVESKIRKDFDIFSESFSRAMILTDEENRIIVSYGNRVLWFNPAEVTGANLQVPLVFSDFQVNNKPVSILKDGTHSEFSLSKHISTTSQIEVSHKASTLSFAFGSLDLSYRDKIQYKYKMEGFDKGWIYLQSRGMATYTNLDPGAYTFLIMSRYMNGEWHDGKNSIKVIVHPPFWRTWWFTVIEILCAAGIIWFFINYRVSRSLEIERLRGKIASDLHDEVGSSLTRISIYSDLLQNSANSSHQKNYLSSISSLSREIVDTMSDIIWSIDNSNDSLGSLVNRMKDCAAEMTKTKNFRIEFNTDHINEKKVLDPVLRQNLYLIFKESINNIVKHSGADFVKVHISNSHEGFIMLINDNGKGINLRKDKMGNGLRNMDKRALAINATLNISNGVGTTLELCRPTI